jgi:hypothetical protein
MAAWTLVPCLVQLRTEFNAIAPNRDKGADGSIGDSNHTSASDHTPDEDSRVLRDHDADTKNEVHALDIDSSGPWPAGRSFKQIVLDVIAGERAKWRDPDDMCRLNYVIFDRKIYDKDSDFQPRDYRGSDPHTNHAHFSARYETRAEADTRPWGVEEDDMPTAEEIAKAVWAYPVTDFADKPKPGEQPRKLAAGTWLGYSDHRHRLTESRIGAAIAGLDTVDEVAVAAAVLAVLTPQAIAAALPDEIAEQVANELATRLAS